MASRGALAVLFLMLVGLSTSAGQLDGPVSLFGDGLDVAFFPMPDCGYFAGGSWIDDETQMRRFVGERCGGAKAPALDFTKRTLVGLHISLDCHGRARIVVRRDDASRMVHVHTVWIDGGCRAMGRGGTYWISMPKIPEGYSLVFTGSRVDRGDLGDLKVDDPARDLPAAERAVARAAAASLVVVETFESAAADSPAARASGFALGDGRVVTSAGAMKWAVAARVGRPGSSAKFPVTGVVGLDLVRDLCVLEVPGLEAEPVPRGEVPGRWGRLFVATPVAIDADTRPDEAVKVAIASNAVTVGERTETGLVELSTHVGRESFGAPVLDEAGRVAGIITVARGENGYSGFLVPAALFDESPIKTRMPVSAAGYLARTDAEAAGFIYGRVRRVREKVLVVARDSAGAATREPAVHVFEWLYDLRGMVTSYSWTRGEWVHEVQYEYDARGLITVRIERDSRWRVGWISKRRSEAEAIVEAARYGGPTRTDELHDGGGRTVRYLDREGGVVRVAEFDATGRLIAETVSTKENGLVTRVVRTTVKRDGKREVEAETGFEYEYDKRSHWTRRTARERRRGSKGASEPTEIAERTIEYYEP